MSNPNRTTSVKRLSLPSGQNIPALGQGTWRMGENSARRKTEIEALRLGLDLGMSLIDTAEMYGEGGAEMLVGEVIAGRRDDVFLVSKVYPHNASLTGAVKACERSLRRLKTDYLDIYLLHWRGAIPLEETLEAFLRLKESGKIRDFGVSNFDLDDMVEAFALPGGKDIVTNQVLYNLVHRGVEFDLLPWCRDHNIAVMAYSPIEHSPVDQRVMLDHPALKSIATRHGCTTAQVALAWLVQRELVAIPKAGNPQHVRENSGTLTITLAEEDFVLLDKAFPPPVGKVPLEMR